jgi:uncharacterized delta-60 repeat protein
MTKRDENAYTPGDIDLTFGLNGQAPLLFPNGEFTYVYSIVASKERILVAGEKIGTSGAAGDFMIGCLSENGVVDLSFGRDGSITGNFNGYESRAQSITVMEDGKLLITGHYRNTTPYYLPAACRLLPSGDLDDTFGIGGTFIFPADALTARDNPEKTSSLNNSEGGNEVGGCAVLPDGKIMIYQALVPPGVGLLVRLNADGKLDDTFDGKGYVEIKYPGPKVSATTLHSLIVEPDGKFLVGGQVNFYETFDINGFVACLNPDGSPDTSFGQQDTGFTEVDLRGESGKVSGLTRSSSGKIFGIGFIGTIVNFIASTRAMAFGMLPEGKTDPDFNGGKPSTINLEMPSFWDSILASPLDNRIVASGYLNDKNGTSPGLLVGRYLTTGEFDKSFGNGKGWTILEPGILSKLAVQADGKVLVSYKLGDGTLGKPCTITRLLP